MPGIGKVMEKTLAALGECHHHTGACVLPLTHPDRSHAGVHSCGELFDARPTLARVFTEHTSRWLLRASMGISRAMHVPFAAHRDRKSLRYDYYSAREPPLLHGYWRLTE